MAQLSEGIAPTDLVKEFRRCVQDIEVICAKVQDLERLIRTGEIPRDAAQPIKEESTRSLLVYAERFFTLEDKLEAERARTRLELEGSRREFERSRSLELAGTVQRLEDHLRQIEDAFKSTDLQTELTIVKYYLMFLSSALQRNEITQQDFERQKEVYRRFLDAVAERWAYQKVELAKQLTDLEPKSEQLSERLKELLIRFTVGEYEEDEYNRRKSSLEEELGVVDQGLQKLRNYMDAVDGFVFECYLLYSQPRPEVTANFEELVLPDGLPKIEELVSLNRPQRGPSSTQAMYDELVKLYISVWSPAKLERDIRRLTERGLSKEQAVLELYQSMKGKG